MCAKPLTAAVIGSNGAVVTPASAECRTSALTRDEFRTLRGKMERQPGCPQRQRVPGWDRELAHGSLHRPRARCDLRESIALNGNSV